MQLSQNSLSQDEGTVIVEMFVIELFLVLLFSTSSGSYYYYKRLYVKDKTTLELVDNLVWTVITLRIMTELSTC